MSPEVNEITEATRPSSVDPVERTDRLREAANSSASLVRNLFLTFLLFGTYIAVTIGATTDEQLLRISPVNLPILNVNLPIVAFYTLVPWLLVLFHFTLLLQLYLLARQLHLFNAAVATIADERERAEQRIRLFPFPFVHMLAGTADSRVTRVLFSLIFWVTTVWLPLALIISAQVRFLPYHDPVVIAADRLAVLVDLGLLWLFWPLIVSPSERPTADWWRSVCHALTNRLFRLGSFFRRGWQGGAKNRHRARGESEARGLVPLVFTSVLAAGFSFGVAVVPGEWIEQWIASYLPAPHADQDPAHTGGGNLLTYWVFDGPRAPLHRNLQLAESILLANTVGPELLRELMGADKDKRSAALTKVSGIDLSGRDLRYASFHRAILPHADMRGANLDGADLRRADLSSADLRPLEIEASGSCVDGTQMRRLESKAPGAEPDADMAGGQYVADAPVVCLTALRYGTRLNEARLTGASLNLALLEDADLREAALDAVKMPGATLAKARLDKANLQKAVLDFTDLTHANLTSAQLDGAEMRRVKLTGAVFRRTSLKDAKLLASDSENLTMDEPDLTHARFRTADLRNAVIKRGDFADFYGSDLRGANMERGDFRGANFGKSDLRGAVLSGAKLQGANFEGADLSDAQLDGAKLDLAKFIRMSACGADFSGAAMRGVHFFNVAMHGATLKGADLSLAKLSQVQARGLDVRTAQIDGADIYSLEVDYGDLRSLAGNTARGIRIPGLQVIAKDLLSNEHKLTPDQEKALAASERGLPLRDSARSDAIVTRAPVLCDATTSALLPTSSKHCLTEEALGEYVGVVAVAACENQHIAAGVAHRLSEPRQRSLDRGGGVTGTPPVEEYTRLLAVGMATDDCRTLATLKQSKKDLLSRILQRSNVAVPSLLTGAAADEQDAPNCSYSKTTK